MKLKIDYVLVVSVIMLTFTSCEFKQKENSMGGETLSHVEVDNELDPVCNMHTKDNVRDTLTYQKKIYGFCSSNCKEEFQKNPNKYLSQNQ